jgi:hypothetical protein
MSKGLTRQKPFPGHKPDCLDLSHYGETNWEEDIVKVVIVTI